MMSSFKLKRTIFCTNHIANYFFINFLKISENIYESTNNYPK